MGIETGRLGTFFFFIGLVLWVIFFASDQAIQQSYAYFFLGAVALFLGVYLWRHGRKQAQEENERFRTIRRIRQKSLERRERKKAKSERHQAERD